MIDFIQNCIDGLMLGSSYSLLAIGFTLIFGVMRRLNLSFGPSIMLGAFFGTFLFLEFDANRVIVAVGTVAGAVMAGIYVERLCFWAIRRGAVLASMVSSFVIWMQFEESITLLFPERTYPFPLLIDARPLEFGPYFIKQEYALMFGCAIIIMAALHLLLHYTRFGLHLRAISENPLAARFMGINIPLITFAAFVLASTIGGIAGFLIIGADGQITPLFGLWATFKGLVAMMLGGMGSIIGAVVGGLLLGMVESHSVWYLGTEFRDLMAYLLLFLFLIVRPGGIMAQKTVLTQEAAFRRV